MNVRSLLTEGLDYFEQHKLSYTAGALARNAAGEKVMPNDPYARCWCALGMLLKVADLSRFRTGEPEDVASLLLLTAAQEQEYISVGRASDAVGRAGVIVLYRRALVHLDHPDTRIHIAGLNS